MNVSTKFKQAKIFMKNITRIILVLIFTAIGISAQEKAKISDKAKDEALIGANVEQMAKGWNTKSGVEFAQPFSKDADYVVNSGFDIKGFPSSVKGLQQLFDTTEKNSMVTYTVEQIRFLRPDVAVVHVIGEMKMVQGDSTQSGKGRITMVMTKTGDKWEIAAFQNTPIQEFEAKGEK